MADLNNQLKIDKYQNSVTLKFFRLSIFNTAKMHENLLKITKIYINVINKEFKKQKTFFDNFHIPINSHKCQVEQIGVKTIKNGHIIFLKKFRKRHKF